MIVNYTDNIVIIENARIDLFLTLTNHSIYVHFTIGWVMILQVLKRYREGFLLHRSCKNLFSIVILW